MNNDIIKLINYLNNKSFDWNDFRNSVNVVCESHKCEEQYYDELWLFLFNNRLMINIGTRKSNTYIVYKITNKHAFYGKLLLRKNDLL